MSHIRFSPIDNTYTEHEVHDTAARLEETNNFKPTDAKRNPQSIFKHSSGKKDVIRLRKLANRVQLSRLSVPQVSQDQIDMVKNWKPYQDLVAKLRTWDDLVVKGVEVQSVTMFGPRVGFAKINVNCTDGEGNFVPGVCFLRGNSVAVLLQIVGPDGKLHGILTVQKRVPIGRERSYEIPAGMMDGGGNFGGTAAKELEEETGLTIPEDELFPLSPDGTENNNIIPSAGACDEEIALYFYRRSYKGDEKGFDKFKEKLTTEVKGEIDEGERIFCVLVPWEEMIEQCRGDAKTLSALCLYDHINKTKKGKITRHFDQEEHVKMFKKSNLGEQ